MAVILKKKIEFGKFDFTGNGRKTNAADVEIELRKCCGEPTFRMVNGKREYTGEVTPEFVELSICGTVWNNSHTDCIMGGQCLDEMAKVIKTPTFQKIHKVWKDWHLNGMKAGTPEQEAKVKEWLADGHKYDYSAVCDMLKDCGMYEVEYTGLACGKRYDHEPYRYGHGWIVKELPDDVIEFVKGVC